MTQVPFVIEKTANGERSMDIGSRLLQDRIIVLGEAVNEVTATLRSAFISKVQEALYLMGLLFMTQCSISNVM